MICPRRREQNPSEANFCVGCGARLAQSCASCGIVLPRGSRFCYGCGTAVAALAGTPASAATAAPHRVGYVPSLPAVEARDTKSWRAILAI